ncbi:MAG: GNAT family N-acetyltransferase [Thermoplasmata archaeon]|nr:GNAT family N-acetyltransferase [Thermoplasmata archaeon]
MDIELRRLDHKELDTRINIFQYDSPGHYKVRISEKDDGWIIDLKKEDFPNTFHKKENEKVITPYKGNSEIHGAFVGGQEVGFIQFEFQDWNATVRVWDIDVLPDMRRKGVGKTMMDLCKTRSRELGARRIILETQTSNLKAIEFYSTYAENAQSFRAEMNRHKQ